VVQLGAIAEYVDKRPGDTLVNQPTRFDLVIDFMIAKAIGLTVPRSRCSAAPTGLNNTSSHKTATLAVHCGNDFDAGFRPYQSTRLRR
jgi:hypothetical protein